MSNQKFTCFTCGHQTLDARCDWDICPVCLWEDDILVQSDEDDRKSPANSMTVSEAQANYMRFGACSEAMAKSVREPSLDEPLDSNWKPLAKALELAKSQSP